MSARTRHAGSGWLSMASLVAAWLRTSGRVRKSSGGRPRLSRGMVSDMPTEKEVLRINGHEVTVTNPRKVYFPETGHTKLDLVNYYLTVAEGALRGVEGRPMAMKRFVNGAGSEPFFQKRAPANRPAWIVTVELRYPSGRTADEIVVRNAATLAWIVNL